MYACMLGDDDDDDDGLVPSAAEKCHKLCFDLLKVYIGTYIYKISCFRIFTYLFYCMYVRMLVDDDETILQVDEKYRNHNFHF